MSDADTATAMAMDAGRSAAAVLRAMRQGDHQSWQVLVSTLTELERGYLCGALASFANQALNMCDQLAEIARDNGAPIKASGDDVLNAIALGFK